MKQLKLIILIQLFAALVICSGLIASADNKTVSSGHVSLVGEVIVVHDFTSSATEVSSTNNILLGSLGEVNTGMVSSTNNILYQGLWSGSSQGAPWTCGDATSDGAVDVSDAVYVINFAFGGGPEPVPLESGDANCDSSVDISDAVFIITYAFGGGNPPCDPDGDGNPDC